MNIAFLHYHLKTGGVTTVIRQQIEAVSDTCGVVVLTGAVPETDFPARTVVIPGLGYDSETDQPVDPETTADAVIQALGTAFAGGCDIIHVHNPTLAKNRNFLAVLKRLQTHGLTLFLQIHDFAEDGRPSAYFPEPYVPDCHYGVINSRDQRILKAAGLQKEGLHYIPNTINPLPSCTEKTATKKLVLYPVRAIRRKNIGEALLVSLFFQHHEVLAITLPPNSPADIEQYVQWKTFADRTHLNVRFEAGLHDDFVRLVHSAEFLITTSITEAFGFTFLEPWTAWKPLWGRGLSDICADFENNGIRLDHLYRQLRVPVEWIGEKVFFDRWASAIQRNSIQYHFPIQVDAIQDAFKNISRNKTIDFGLLDEGMQRRVLLKLLESKKNITAVKKLNPFLSSPGNIPDRERRIQLNRSAVLRRYTLDSYKRTLNQIYGKVVNTPVRHRIHKERLLSQFFNLENFSLLKWSAPQICKSRRDHVS